MADSQVVEILGNAGSVGISPGSERLMLFVP